MSRNKKARKGGENSPKLAPRTKKTDRDQATKKKNTGNKSGSRHNENLIQEQLDPSAAAKRNDARHGSKKPVALTLPTTKAVETNKPKQAKITDEQKLLQLEEDPRLNKLLDMLEEGRDLNQDDQQWLDKQLNKIEALMSKLGITEEDESNSAPAAAPARKASDDELLEQFESGADLLKDYQN